MKWKCDNCGKTRNSGKSDTGWCHTRYTEENYDETDYFGCSKECWSAVLRNSPRLLAGKVRRAVREMAEAEERIQSGERDKARATRDKLEAETMLKALPVKMLEDLNK